MTPVTFHELCYAQYPTVNSPFFHNTRSANFDAQSPVLHCLYFQNYQAIKGVNLHNNPTAKMPMTMRCKGVTKRKLVGGGSASVDKTESISDVDDSEVVGYLNTKEERYYKKIIWEKINQQSAVYMAQAKACKKDTEAKKDKSRKATANNTSAGEREIRSSIINFAALNQLNDELNQDLGEAVVGGAGTPSPKNSSSSDAKFLIGNEPNDTYSDYLHVEDQSCEEDDDALTNKNFGLLDEYDCV
ncbi:unnamed protein product [Cuscuta epithymum]|uniref:Brf1 TBP-binding domain-containing protein n=1 Tax=Cuscuta epithymum TaxID=186058 RepID=A0AAV0DVC2_9ASTE|nr:unnamed protein product [Cuscuta epithymum]